MVPRYRHGLVGAWLVALVAMASPQHLSNQEETATFVNQYRTQRTVQFWADTLTALGYTLTWTSATTFEFIGVSYTTTDPIGPLYQNPLLFDIADKYVRDLHSRGGYCRHEPATLSRIAREQGWTGALPLGEVGACGIKGGETVVKAWTESLGHAATMYAPRQQQVGVGIVADWTFAIFSREMIQ